MAQGSPDHPLPAFFLSSHLNALAFHIDIITGEAININLAKISQCFTATLNRSSINFRGSKLIFIGNVMHIFRC